LKKLNGLEENGGKRELVGSVLIFEVSFKEDIEVIYIFLSVVNIG
jgi:hypothetical protein